MRKLRWPLAAVAVLAVTALVLQKRSRSRSTAAVSPSGRVPAGPQPRERRAEPDAEALRATPAGPPARVGLDLAKLRQLQAPNYKPLMEYLNYIQVQRGATESLLFVRFRDLDELADLAGQSRDQLTSEFKKLGVLLSMN